MRNIIIKAAAALPELCLDHQQLTLIMIMKYDDVLNECFHYPLFFYRYCDNNMNRSVVTDFHRLELYVEILLGNSLWN